MSNATSLTVTAMSSLAQGTLPEDESHDAVSDRDGFTELDLKFFADGEALSKQTAAVDVLVDLGGPPTSFFQRLWRR